MGYGTIVDMQNNRKIAVFVSFSGRGGVERMIVNLCEGLVGLDCRMILGLRIDVDTFRGTREGIPRLRRILGRYGIKATFYLTVGPDNMGRHLFRLLKPRFIAKMVRSSAPCLYGYSSGKNHRALPS